MKILILTSCTGKKKSKPENQLTLDDFRSGQKHLKQRTEEFKEHLVPAGELYTGGQHLCLLRALKHFRHDFPKHHWDLKIVSAGYGLLSEDDQVTPEVTFNTMRVNELREWADFLQLLKPLEMY